MFFNNYMILSMQNLNRDHLRFPNHYNRKYRYLNVGKFKAGVTAPIYYRYEEAFEMTSDWDVMILKNLEYNAKYMYRFSKG